MGGARRGLYALPERMPGLRAYRDIQGCAFAPRCPHVIDDCTRAPPLFAEVGAAHRAACIRASQTTQIAAPAPAPSDQPARTAPILEVSGLSKRFASSRGLFRRAGEFIAVRNVSFALHENEFVGIVGESGSGKSTLARLIVGLETPSEGGIAIAGRDARAADFDQHRRRSVQMVFQDPQSALNPRRRVASIVTQPLEAAGIATLE